MKKIILSLILLLLTILNSAYASNVTNGLTIGKSFAVSGGYVTSLNRFDGSFEKGTSNFVVSTGTLTQEASIAMEGNYRGSWVTTAAGTLDTVAQTITATDTYELNALIDSSDSANVEICANINGSDNACKKILNRTGRQKASWIGQLNTGDSAKIRVRYSGTNDTIKVDNFKYEPWTQQVASLTIQESYRADGHSGYGSSNTKIPYFTNVRENSSSRLISVSNSSITGFSVTALEQCYLEVHYTYLGRAGGVADYSGISLNSSQLTTGISSINSADRLSVSGDWGGSTNEDNLALVTSTVVKLNAGDVIRPHNEGNTPSAVGIVTFSVKASKSTDNVIQTWQDGTELTSYTMSPTGSTSNPTKGTSILKESAKYKFTKEGTMKIVYEYNHNSGAVTLGSGTYLFNLPSGYSIDLSKTSTSTDARLASIGSGKITDGSTDGLGASVYDCEMFAYDATRIKAACHDQGSGNLRTNRWIFSSTVGPNYQTSNLGIYFNAEVPILGRGSTPSLIALPTRSEIFSANVSASGTVTNATQNFVTSCTNAAPSVCSLWGSFALIPICYSHPIDITKRADVSASTATQTTVARTDTSTAFNLFCHLK